MKIPFLDLKSQYQKIKNEIDEVYKFTFDQGIFIGGDEIKRFEANFATYLRAGHCIACANATDALEIILRAFDIGRGDEVLVPANGWPASAEAVVLAGAKPVFVDSHPDFYTIDPVKIKEKITGKTKAVIPVHLYGLPADMDKIMKIALKNNLKVIEDCAQAHGALYKGKRVGNLGDAAAFSFYPTKNLGAYGDGGAMVTNDKNLAEKLRMMADHGQKSKNDHRYIGKTSRMDVLQAGFLNVKLAYLDYWNEQRSQHAGIYHSYLKNLSIKLPKIPDYAEPVFHLYVIRVNYRSRVIKFLKKKGIETAIHYPQAVPLLPAFQFLGYKKEDFPVAATQADHLLSIPIYPELEIDDISYITEVFNAYFQEV